MDEKTMIRVIDARLRYLFADCPADMVNPEEVNALVNLLKEYEPDASGGAPSAHYIVHIQDSYPDAETIIAMMAVIVCVVVLVLLVELK